MVNSIHEDQIRKAVKTKHHEQIRSAFQSAVREEIATLRINESTKAIVAGIVGKLDIPSKTDVRIVPAVKTDKAPASPQGNTLVIICFLLLLVVSGITYFTESLWVGVIVSVVCGGFFSQNIKQGVKKPIQPKPQVEVQSAVDAEQLLSLVDEIVLKAKALENEQTIQTPVSPSLNEMYPNVLKWLQMVYADAVDFDEGAKSYLLKRIRLLAKECHYDLVVFTGDNQEMFKTQKDVAVSEPTMYMPSFVYTKTGEVVLPGIVYVP